MEKIDKKYLSPTAIIDSDSKTIIEFATDTIGETKDPIAKAIKLYYAIRDGIWYDPYSPFYLPEHYIASNVLKSGRGFCVSKAVLLCALGRASMIPSRVGFATVRNHLATKQLIEFFGSNLFVFHGFTEFYLNGRWTKATPAFNQELCQKHRVAPLEFNGREDSIFQVYNTEKRLFMEYVEDHGAVADIAVDKLLSAWKQAYGEDRFNGWIEMFERSGGRLNRNFYEEEIQKD